MKKVLTFIIIFTILFIPIFNKTSYYTYAESNLIQQRHKEKNYLKELEHIQKQIYILSSNVLKCIIEKHGETDRDKTLKDIKFIKTQIRELRVELIAYHKSKSSDIEKNPISLALLNTSNYCSMCLSYLVCLLDEHVISNQNDCLQGYYFSKYQADQTLMWLENQIK
ncbi:Uncharacterised protein [[Clostridium] sordellii]|uniref:hypothetical protein n=1 Tax=Paraclostridium sordellii TaxID=1505 RepID=UPI0005E09276|nr:hypothetical protein [Paeniclostridium sordellii]CEN84238.1 Uncharacterised protein [[Clostridium] sordellii] [Paeniclostridium sordellii]CEO09498.1 Uncharacterised protein [[Clostridium] sordellii] [Paeniclostridium sordellii]